jgi:iron-sulfur cluster repair protein YtfE (RIC family)
MSEPATITVTLTTDHRDCDRLLCAVALRGRKTDWARVVGETASFRAAMERHFQFEEEVLFPPLEAVSPMAMGPTEMMRQQHAQIRVLMDDLGAAASAEDADEYAGISETLHFLIQQHNAKEEGILYPLADRALGAEGAVLAARLGESD